MDSNQPQPFTPSASKLPIKRKAPLPPKLEFQPIILPEPLLSNSSKFGLSPMRSISSKPSSDPLLSFPKDLPLFYSFSHSCPILTPSPNSPKSLEGSGKISSPSPLGWLEA
ncbi:hypothetical protein V6N13_036829 [Hibiscus sabdariffa]